ncbi:MAG: putative cobalt transporter subunit (CbtB) [Chloroflexi bacterium]|nr:putative cobalt transporter subunit (CbtB) [Chloroflexota bacterium]
MEMQAQPALQIPWRSLLVATALALVALFILGLDQGQTLAMVQGNAAYEVNWIHEFVHDARHAAGFPCH